MGDSHMTIQKEINGHVYQSGTPDTEIVCDGSCASDECVCPVDEDALAQEPIAAEPPDANGEVDDLASRMVELAEGDMTVALPSDSRDAADEAVVTSQVVDAGELVDVAPSVSTSMQANGTWTIAPRPRLRA